MPFPAHRLAGMILSAAVCAVLPLATASAAGTGPVYAFTGGADGATPMGGLTPDSSGNFYGTTEQAGDFLCGEETCCGTIYKLDSSGKLTTLYAFPGGTAGGVPITGVSLIRGLLYGNSRGGPHNSSPLFTIRPDGSAFTILHDLTKAEGQNLIGLIQPAAGGGVFGLGAKGGQGGNGTLFYLGQANQLLIAHYFAGGTDGASPNYLIEDAAGNLFGSTTHGGGCTGVKNGCGVIFEYAPKTRAYTILYTFLNGPDGSAPLLGAIGPDGTLYGAAKEGGATRQGTLFALTPGTSGYAFSVLTPIMSTVPADSPSNPPTLTPDGSLIGATYYGGNYVFQNGSYSIYYHSAGSPTSQYAIPAGHPDTFLGTSQQGGQTGGTCILVEGCGTVFYGQQ